MSIHIEVKFFASMRERAGCAETTVELPEGSRAADVWSAVMGKDELPQNTLVAVNMEYEKPDVVIKDGDEVAFFPPVTGGQDED